MNAQQIHDALTLLPADLIVEADGKRSRKRKPISWTRIAAIAACFVLVLGCSGYALAIFGAKGGSSKAVPAEEAMLQAPTMVPGFLEDQESNREAPAAEAAPMEEAPAAAEPADGLPEHSSGATSNLCIDHGHIPAESAEGTKAPGAWFGNMTAVIHIGELEYTLSGPDAVTVTEILHGLDYQADQLCACAGEFTVDTEMGEGYEVHLKNWFVRHQGGQADLTLEQTRAIREALPMIGGETLFTQQAITPERFYGSLGPDAVLITSRQELEDYWQQFGENYDFSRMKDACSAYTEGWFADRDLLLNRVRGREDNTVWTVDALLKGGGKGWEWSIFLSEKGLPDTDTPGTVLHLMTELEKGIVQAGEDLLQVY